VLFAVAMTATAIKVLAGVEQATVALPGVAASNNLQAPGPQVQSAFVDEGAEPSQMQRELEAWIKNKPSSWAFYVQSVDENEPRASIHENKQFQMASIYKLFLLKPLASKIPAEAWGNSSITDRTYLDCVQAMISVSNNPCAEAIASKLGWTSIHKQTQSDGYKSTSLNSIEKFNSSVADTGLLLDRLFHGDGYDAKTKSIALEALAKRKGAEAIRRACTECSVYNKTGDLNGNKHDAAIVEKNGKVYIVVIFSSGATWPQLTEAAKIISSNL